MLVIGSVFSQIFRSVISGVDWNPSVIFYNAEPGVWFDPSDLSTLFQDSAGTTPVTTAGQTVGKMLDKSGRGNHATQATLAQRPTYQIDGTGRPYLSFDGVNDSMVTNTITPAINKVQVFAGVQKLSDATAGIVAELSVTSVSNAGTFNVLAPSSTGASGNFAFYSKGTTTPATAATSAITLAPVTAVLTGLGDIAGDLMSIRTNSTVGTNSTLDQGSGNFLAYPLYIGRRAGTALPFNGRIYSLIVRFGPSLTTDQIASAENWVNSKTGAY